MVPEEQEFAHVPGSAEVDDHHAVFGWLDAGLDVGPQRDHLHVGQVADEHRVLDALPVAFDARRDGAEPTIIPDVIRDQKSAPGHACYLVTSGSYWDSSPVRCAASIRACSSTARR